MSVLLLTILITTTTLPTTSLFRLALVLGAFLGGCATHARAAHGTMATATTCRMAANGSDGSMHPGVRKATAHHPSTRVGSMVTLKPSGRGAVT